MIFAGHENGLAVVTYATPTEPVQRFMVSANGQLSGEQIEYPDPLLGWAEGDSPPVPDLEVWSFDGTRDLRLVDNLSLLVQVAPELEIRIPLVAERLALDQAQVPVGLTITELPVEPAP